MWKTLRQLTLNKTRHIRSVTGTASQKVRRVRRWVFNFTFSKIVIPILVLGFILLVLNPYKDIQVVVAAGFLLFFFLFCLHTREEGQLLDTLHHTSHTQDVIFPAPSLFLQLYSRLPLSAGSRVWGAVTSQELPYPLNIISVWLFAVITGCHRDEAEYSDLSSYKTVSQFFTRRLRPGVRPISPERSLVSPCDGTVTYSGLVTGPYLQQVKGVHYSLKVFLGSLENIYENKENTEKRGQYYLKQENTSETLAGEEKLFKQVETPRSLGHQGLLTEVSPTSNSTSTTTSLYQTVIYLSPSDYHRFHSPTDWLVLRRRYFPGKLYSVEPSIVRRIPGLFHTNERVAFFGRWVHGFFSMVAVGATNVGSINVHFDQDLITNTEGQKNSTEIIYSNPIAFKKGEEFGYFNFGSTIVLIYEAPVDSSFNPEFTRRVKMGEGMYL